MPDTPDPNAPVPAVVPEPPKTPAPASAAVPEPTTPTTTPDTPVDPAVTVDDAALGDAGKQALVRERAAHQTAVKELTKLKADAEKARVAALSEHEKAILAARTEGATTATTAANSRIVAAELRVAAATKLADPSDAARYIDLAQFIVGDDGTVDTAAMAAEIDTLLTTKPYLGATPGAAPPPPRVPAGASGRGPGTLTLDEQIQAAQKAGNMREAIRLENTKFDTAKVK